MHLGLLGTFWAVSLVFVVTPGVDWAYCITAGLSYPRVAPAVSGLVAGHLLATLSVAAGVAALVAGTPTVLDLLTAAGATYLIWLGVITAARAAGLQGSRDADPASWGRQAFRGFGVSGLNPKVLVLFLALLPQFTDPAGGWPTGVQVLVLGLLHVANCAAVYAVVGVGARLVLRTRPAAARVVSRLSGATMIGLGGFLLIEHVVH